MELNMRTSDTCMHDLEGEECSRWPGYVLVDTCHPGDTTPDVHVLACWRHMWAVLAFNRGENPEHAWEMDAR